MRKNKLFDGKGFEWYHLLIFAAVVGFFAFKYGADLNKGEQYCDVHNIEMINKAFEPQSITIHPCDKIIWTNMDSGERHTITFKASGNVDGCPEGMVCTMEGDSSGELTFKQTFERTFNEKGTFDYYSDSYPQVMTGRVIVK